jgi:hypothetical protein
MTREMATEIISKNATPRTLSNRSDEDYAYGIPTLQSHSKTPVIFTFLSPFLVVDNFDKYVETMSEEEVAMMAIHGWRNGDGLGHPDTWVLTV